MTAQIIYDGGDFLSKHFVKKKKKQETREVLV